MATRPRLRLGLAALLGALACVQHDGSRLNPIDAYIQTSVDEEREIGAAFDSQIQQHIRSIDDPVVLEFLDDLGQSIVRGIEPQPFIYRFRIIVDPSLNAFAVPGGYVYIHTGTILQAGTLDELAGVVAHEIGHVKGHHYARMREKAAIPDLLAKVAGIAAAAATGEPGVLLASEGLNVALQLRFSREFESEADEIGQNFMARAGYHPEELARFFERIVTASHDVRFQMPPYLYTHPDVEDRIASVLSAAGAISVTGAVPSEASWAFRECQVRLAQLVDGNATTLLTNWPAPDRSRSDPLIASAKRAAEGGDLEGGLAMLEEAERLEPYDARVSFQRAERLEKSGKTREAISAYRRALALDPPVALVYYRIGMAYLSLGDRQKAAFFVEQAVHRLNPKGPLGIRAGRALERINFPPLDTAGISDGIEGGSGEPFGSARQEFRTGDERVVWWGRLAGRYLPYRDRIRVRFTDPSGAVAQQKKVERARRPYVRSTLELDGDLARRHGIWRVEALMDGIPIDERTFRLAPALPHP